MPDWENVLKTNYELLIGYLVAYVPQILGALILLLIGWVVAWVCARLSRALVTFTARLVNKLNQALALQSPLKIPPHYAKIVGRTVFWLIMVFFFAASLSSLGVDFIASWLRELLGYLPNLLAGTVIVIAGFFIANIAKTMVEAAAHGTGLKYSGRIGLLTKWMIVGIAVVIGIEQLGMNIQFITSLLIVEIAVFSFGIALAYGLGSHDLVKNLVGARQAVKHLNVGERVKIAGFEGKIRAFSASTLELETSKGKVLIPARLYNEMPCEVVSELDSSKEH